jgi:hypothetical protein
MSTMAMDRLCIATSPELAASLRFQKIGQEYAGCLAGIAYKDIVHV